MIAHRVRIVWISVLGLLFLTAFTNGNAIQKDIFTDVESALSIGNANKLSELLNNTVELELPGEQEGIYSKQQTVVILNRFFNRYPPTAFKIVHRGNSPTGSRYAVGDYTTGTDKTFRVTVFVKKHGETYLIQEIEFE